MRIDQIRNSVQNEELDYVMLMSLFSGYSHPRARISYLLKSGDLIRVKKGLYVFGPGAARVPYSVETLANLIYGPSAISFETALSWYGMIPERVTIMQNVTISRNKRFTTPVGIFTYTHQHPDAYVEGIQITAIDSTHHILIASREKALTDLLTLRRPSPHFESIEELRVYLEDNMRIEREELLKLSISRLRRLESATGKSVVSLLRMLVQRLREHAYA